MTNTNAIITAIFVFSIITLILLRMRHTIQNNTFDGTLERMPFDEMTFNTGDIIFFRYSRPLIKYKNPISNMVSNVRFFIASTLILSTQKYFLHSGVIIRVNDIPYILELDRYPHYDNYTGTHVLRRPSLSHIDRIKTFDGNVYKYDYIGTPLHTKKSALVDIYSKNIKYNTSLTDIIFGNWLKLTHQKKNHMVCTDFVMYVLSKLDLVQFNPPYDINDERLFITNNPLYELTPILMEN